MAGADVFAPSATAQEQQPRPESIDEQVKRKVASRANKGQLGDPLAARLTGMAWCVTFAAVGELWQWATTRSWGPRTREDFAAQDGLQLITSSR